MKKFAVLLTSFVFLPIFFSPAFANTNNKPVVSVKVDKKEMLIGDHLKYDVKVVYPSGLIVGFPELEDKLGHFDILSRAKSAKKSKWGKSEEMTLKLVVSAYDRGEYVLPGFPVIYIDSFGKTNYAASESVKVLVKGVLSGQITPDLKDIKQQENLSDPFLWLKIFLLIALVVGIIFLYKYREKIFPKKLIPVVAKLEPELPPDVEAINRLNDVIAREVLEQSGVKEYYSLINEIIRHYLHRVYGIISLERTTDEIIADLKKVSLPSSLSESLGDFLMDSDLVKFAKMVPGKNETKGFIDIAFSIIEQTRPKVIQSAGESS